eukprot:jgi/Chrzof1/6436/Cz18g10180.t1
MKAQAKKQRRKEARQKKKQQQQQQQQPARPPLNEEWMFAVHATETVKELKAALTAFNIDWQDHIEFDHQSLHTCGHLCIA